MKNIKKRFRSILYRAFPFSYVLMFHHITESPKIEKLYCAPGNGGIEKIAECVNISACDIPKMVEKLSQQGSVGGFVQIGAKEAEAIYRLAL